MLIKLHDRRLRSSSPLTGLSCDRNGVAFGDHVLIERTSGDVPFRRRPIAEINRALSQAYGCDLDLSSRTQVLDGIADQLNKGDLGRAQLLALQLHLPDSNAPGGAEPLLKAARLLRFNPNHDERGRFTFADGGRSAKFPHKTPRGTRYSTAIRLNAKQQAITDKIVDYGVAHGFSPDQIGVVVGQAFSESDLGQLRNNHKNDAKGIFQYLPGDWGDFHSELNRSDDGDQIVAMYQDLSHFESTYEAGQRSGSVPKSIFFSSYVHLMHNFGRYSVAKHPTFFSDRRQSAEDYGRKAAELGLEF